MRSKNCADGSIFSHEEKYPARTLKIHPLQQESLLWQRRVKTLLPEGYFAGLKQNFAGILIKELAVLEKERKRYRILQRQLLYFCTEEREPCGFTLHYYKQCRKLCLPAEQS